MATETIGVFEILRQLQEGNVVDDPNVTLVKEGLGINEGFAYEQNTKGVWKKKIKQVPLATEALTFGGLTPEEFVASMKPTIPVLEFMLVKNGAIIRYSTDPIDTNASSLGYELFCPHSKEEYEAAKKYLLTINEPRSMGPLGIHKKTSRGDNCSYIPLNSDNMGNHGWVVQDGSETWWASDKTTIREPNGDYYANAYMAIWYDTAGDVYYYNDANNRYAYTTYLCVKRS